MAYKNEGVENKQAVAEMLKILGNHNLCLKPEKCKSLWSRVKYLALIILHSRIWVEPVKVTAVVNWPAPRNINKFKRLIVFLNFHHRFINQFFSTTQPLWNLNKMSTLSGSSRTCD